MSLRTTLNRTSIFANNATGRRYAGGVHWNPPTGYLFGEKPLPAGQSRKRQAWEYPYYFGGGAIIAAVIAAYFYKPNTSISEWAMEEAKKRMEARGDLPKYVPSSQRAE